MATILICEDESPAANLLAQVCRDAGHEAVVTMGAEDCLARGPALRPPLIFLDVMLPGPISGYEICRRFREQDATKGAHIVIVTARMGTVVERTTEQAGADELVYKPFRVQTIEEIIGRVLGKGTG